MRGHGPTKGGSGRSSRVSPRGRMLRLLPEERDLLMRACRHYRNTLPSYLASRRQEVVILDRVLRLLE